MDYRAFYYDDEQAILPEDDLIPSYDDEDGKYAQLEC